MSINPVWSLLISCLALAVSISSFYFQHLRRTRKAYVTTLWCKREGDKFVFEASISNRGNRPVTVSRIWLLAPLKGNCRVRYECESINQAMPLKVQPMSADFLRLPFPTPEEMKLHGLYPSMQEKSVTYELLFYVTDDLGIEHYAQTPAAALLETRSFPEILRSTVQVVPGSKNSENVSNTETKF